MEKITPYTFNLNHSGSLYNWKFTYVAESSFEGGTTSIRDEYGYHGTRLGNIYKPDEVIYYGGGVGTSPVNEGKQIDYWWDAYGTGSGDLHFWTDQTGSITDENGAKTRNTGYFEKQIIFDALRYVPNHVLKKWTSRLKKEIKEV